MGPPPVAARVMVAHVDGKKRCDAWYAEAGPNAGMFRGIILEYRSQSGGGWHVVWKSAKWYASAQQARGAAFNHLRKA